MTEHSTTSGGFTRHLATGEGVYGLILVSGLIATASSAHASSIRVLIFVVVTVAVFWVAHVYANMVASYGRVDRDGNRLTLQATLSAAVRETRGMLVATVFPAGALLLGVFGVLPDRSANWIALWVCVGVLACLGYRAFHMLGAALHVRLLGALATASFGLVIIAAKAIITH